MSTPAEVAELLIQMERAALDRWGAGDPDGFLEISAPDVAYFDPYQQLRVNGINGLRALYESIRGQVKVSGYELLNPHVQVCGSAAVLTFNYVAHPESEWTRWNCTEVYRHQGERWQIIHTHWSYTCHPAIVSSK